MHFCQVSSHCHSRGGEPLFTTTTCMARAPCSHLPPRPRRCLGTQGEWDHPATQRAGLRSSAAAVLLRIACTPTGGGWGTSLVITQSWSGGWGVRKGEEAAFVRRHCFARGKVLLKAACLISWRSRAPRLETDRTCVCSGLPMQSLVLPQGPALIGPLSTIQIRKCP